MNLVKLAIVASLVTLSVSSFAIDKEWIDAVRKTGDRHENETHTEWLDRINNNLDIPGTPQAPSVPIPLAKPRLIADLGASYYMTTLLVGPLRETEAERPTSAPVVVTPTEKPERERTKGKLPH